MAASHTPAEKDRDGCKTVDRTFLKNNKVLKYFALQSKVSNLIPMKEANWFSEKEDDVRSSDGLC